METQTNEQPVRDYRTEIPLLKRIIHPSKFRKLARLPELIAYLEERLSKGRESARNMEAQSPKNPTIWKTPLFCAYESNARDAGEIYELQTELKNLEKYFGI